MERPGRAGEAVVAGGGMAGIAAAAALARAGHAVTLVERDDLGGGESDRGGTPQARQLHNLLSCGQRSLDRVLPGFCEALCEAGASVGRVSTETEVYELGTRMPSRDLGLRLICAPRPLIEGVARRLLSEVPGVTVIDRARVRGVELSSGGAIAAAIVESPDAPRTLPARIVVDATGFRAEGARWLRAAGLRPPRVEAEPVRRWYASATFSRPAGLGGKSTFWMVFPTGRGSRAGLLSPTGRDRWQVSLSGDLGEPPPRDAAEMRAGAAALEVPWIAELLDAASPASPPNVFRKPRAVWRRYDLLREPLPGLLPIGDAVASLNPLFGQGLSVAARQAVELSEAFGSDRGEAGLAALTKEYLVRSAAVCERAWSLGRLVEPGSDAGWMDLDPVRLAARIREDPEFHRLYVGVWHLLEPASRLRERLAGVPA